MLIGTVPFKASSMKDLHSLIKQGYYRPPTEISKGIIINQLNKI